MTNWSLQVLFGGLHSLVENRLDIARNAMGHSVLKGDASENVWLQLLQSYLPERYKARRATVVDSTNAFSDQIDIVIFDRQYSPFVFEHEGQAVVPAESVYAVFESKQSISSKEIA